MTTSRPSMIATGANRSAADAPQPDVFGRAQMVECQPDLGVAGERGVAHVRASDVAVRRRQHRCHRASAARLDQKGVP